MNRQTTRYNKQDTRAAWLMLMPFLVFFVFFVLYPVVMNLFYSFTNYNLASYKWVGLRNYQRLLKDAVFLKAFRNTCVYALASVTLLTALGFVTAAALNRSSRIVRWLRMLLIFPYATSMAAVSMIFLMIFDPASGYLNKILRLIGIPTRLWLFDPDLALGCLIFVNIWKNIGYCMLIYLAGLQSIPDELYEAATMDGAGEGRKLISITLPMIRPIVYFVFVTTTVESFKTFEQVRIMTNGDPLNATTTIVHQIYQRGFTEFKMGYAAAMAVVLLAVILVITLLSKRINAAGRETDAK